MLDPIMVDAIGTIAAAAVTGAAGYVSAKARGIAQSIEEAHQKAEKSRQIAKENRELLAGDPDAGQSVFDRLERIEKQEQDNNSHRARGGGQ